MIRFENYSIDSNRDGATFVNHITNEVRHFASGDAEGDFFFEAFLVYFAVGIDGGLQDGEDAPQYGAHFVLLLLRWLLSALP